MPTVLNVILGAAFAAAVAGAVYLWRRHLEVGRRDDLQALAARRGWSVTMTGERLGRAGTLRLAPRGGHPWTAEARPRPGKAAPQTTDFAAAEPRWAGGTLVLQPAGPDATDAASGPEAGPEAEAALRRLLGDDLGRLAATLRRAPAGDGLLAFSDADPSNRLDLADVARVLLDWKPIARGERGRPILVLSPDGFRLRLRHAVTRADHMERFMDMAFVLSRLIGP